MNLLSRFSSSSSSPNSTSWIRMKNNYQRVIYTTNNLAWLLIPLLVLTDFLICLGITRFVNYTEIDFSTYMQQMKSIYEGERNYSQILGDTGPIVYPAGFVWIYLGLFLFTHQGVDLHDAQILFSILYALTLWIVLLIYRKCKVPVLWFPFLCLSHRLHSIYVLRLFNDAFSMFFLFASLLCLLQRRWSLTSLFFSLALSVKMNILLYAPSFFYLLILNLTPLELMYQVMIMVSVQVSLAFPFLQSYPKEYLGNAFNFSRRFLYEWSVNWQFLSPTTFSSAFFSTMLIFTWCLGTFLLVHLWTQHHHPQNKGLRHVLVPWLQRFFHPRSSSSLSQENKGILPGLSEAHQVYLIFLSHLWGILTSRSLHYQFYSWYAFTVPFLAFKLPYPWVLGTFLISSIEYAWNVYPPNPFSSKVLFGSHLMLFFGGVLFNFLFPSHAQSSSSPTSPSKKIV